jgi:hypothetical protein
VGRKASATPAERNGTLAAFVLRFFAGSMDSRSTAEFRVDCKVYARAINFGAGFGSRTVHPPSV